MIDNQYDEQKIKSIVELLYIVRHQLLLSDDDLQALMPKHPTVRAVIRQRLKEYERAANELLFKVSQKGRS